MKNRTLMIIAMIVCIFVNISMLTANMEEMTIGLINEGCVIIPLFGLFAILLAIRLSTILYSEEVIDFLEEEES